MLNICNDVKIPLFSFLFDLYHKMMSPQNGDIRGEPSPPPPLATPLNLLNSMLSRTLGVTFQVKQLFTKIHLFLLHFTLFLVHFNWIKLSNTSINNFAKGNIFILTIPHRASCCLACENFAKSSFCEVKKLQNAGLPILILSQTD